MTMEGQVLSDVLEVSAESYPTSEKEEKGGEEEEEGGRGGKADAASVPGAGVEECEGQGSSPARGISWQSSTLGGDRPPVMRNEDLMFTYFTLLRRLASTSRLLQRWVASWISFVLLWCVLYIVYWISHSAHLAGILQFLTPLLTLALLTSAYAEVNFEGERLLKCILPTEERLSVFFYFHKIRLELKIFSFTMTYNSIVTVIAGITITFATRIILDQVA
ncbi:uncharacterized protein LOC106013003 [Aplysia californica]|uniref:Uncharacterized protein LOC106013003 n=1 Tax=Aplysia californica TaxID=6500 RepID=A0ABM1A8S9_APLCA|nr:uncharacterized protein LOC106013003 [Aplysia californica]